MSVLFIGKPEECSVVNYHMMPSGKLVDIRNFVKVSDYAYGEVNAHKVKGQPAKINNSLSEFQ